jgi:single-strand DNA-binding protein
VILSGEARQRSWETSGGEKRSAIEVTVTEIGPSLRWATAKVDKTGGKPKPKEDPWASAPADDEAPF